MGLMANWRWQKTQGTWIYQYKVSTFKNKKKNTKSEQRFSELKGYC